MAMPVRCAAEKNRRRSITRRDAMSLRRSAVSLAVGALLGGTSAFAGQPGQILPAGTIPQVRGVVFGNATVNAPVTIPGGNRLTIDQTSQKTIIEWNSFDIARGSEVRFNQPNAGASALNRIFSLDPSLIQGKLTANGQIILINQNGILFDAGSQVNAHSLIASTLGMTDDVFKNGITANLDSSALQFDGVTGYKKIEVAGAANGLAPATLTSDSGGNVILLAPNVVNNGIINSPDGQVILAAGSSVLLFQPRDQNSSQMRGYFVQVTADAGPMNLTSLVTNLGSISADRGNVTLAGLAVNQMGRITAKTAVNRNGSIWLVAQDAATLGAGSVTETPLDTADTTTLADDQDYSAFRASIKVTGNTIIDRGTIQSPSGSVMLSTQQGAAFAFDAIRSSSVTYTPGQAGTSSGPTRIFLDQGAVIDTAGGWVDLSLSKNLVNVRITSNDLKDDPVQKGGSLLGQTVTVDVRKGTPLFDVSGYAGAIQRSVSEKATTGGDISLLSQGDLIVQQGAIMDVSGGGYRYAGGNLKTTTLVSGGRVYDIGNAPIDLRYDSAINGNYQRVHAKWGITETYTTLLSQFGAYEPGYVQGKSAGSITLDGSSVIVNGTMRAGVTAGPLQTTVATMPMAGSLTVGLADSTRPNLYLLNSISFVNRAVALPSGFDGAVDALPQDRVGTALLVVGDLFKPAVSTADRYQQDGFATLSAGANQQIDLPSGMVVRTPVGGGIALTSNTVSIAGSIVASGGNVAIKATGTGNIANGNATLNILSGAQISTAGLWVNDRTNPGATGNQQAFPHAIDGGSVTLASDNVLVVNAGSVIDVSGGATRSTSGSITSGKGGSIKIVGGSVSNAFDSRTSLNGTLLGYSAGTGGTIDVTAAKILIGATTTDAQTLSIGSDFFQSGGFTNYKLTGYYGITLADGVQIAPVADNFVIDPAAAVTPSGGSLAAVAHVTRLPVWQRTAANLSLVASGDLPISALTIGAGSAIRTDPGASVALASRSSLDVLGTIDVPAGSITITQNSELPNPAAVHIGSSAVLSSRGYFMQQPSRLGLVQGQVLRAGTIALNSPGSILIDAGSLIDVSATSMAVQVPGSVGSSSPFTTVNVNGDAGVVSIAAAGSAMLAGELRGNAAPAAAGGTFTLDLTGTRSSGSLARAIVLTQSGAATPGAGTIDGAVLSADALMKGGFDKVRLSSTDAIRFDGNISYAAARSIELGAPVFNVNGGNVKLASNQVRLDGLSIDPARPLSLVSHETSRGSGNFAVSAGLIDLVGGITVNGASQVSLNSSGDIRASGIAVRVAPVLAGDQVGPDSLMGYFVTPGNLSLSARQVYPTTLSQFRFAVADVVQGASALVETPVAGGRIDIVRAAGTPQSVLSIGGNVSFTADTIDVHGTVSAPLGSIAFNGTSNVTLEADSRVSVSLNGLTVPLGVTVNGQTLTYAGIQDVKLPSKSISANAPNVFIKDGAVLDVSGGGELQAVEWVPGIGGSKDVLLADNTYAILPSLRLDYAPYDTDLRARKTLGFNTDAGVYDTVYLAGGNGIAAGYYPLLPGYYALLPGAYKVTPQTGGAAASIQPGQALSLTDGTPLIAGKYAVAGTGIQTQTWSAFAVESGTLVRREAEYTLSNSAFFAAQAVANNAAVPPLPGDAGRFSVSASNQLTFAPTLLGAPAAGGNGAQVDISAPDIVVASGAGGGAGTGVQLDADKLSALNASLLLGGTRADTADGTTLNVGANTVTIAAGATLSGPEIILAANQSVTLESGATVRGAGTFSGTAGDLRITGANGNGALLRASSGNQVNVTRTGTVDRSQGTLTIANGALVTASRSLILDSTQTTQSSGTLAVADGGFVSLGAGAISVGGTGPAPADTLLIGNAELADFSKLDTIALRSYTTIDFNGDVLLGGDGFNGITLDAPAIRGLGAGAASVQARNITLQNTGVNAAVATAGAGSLTLVADSIVLGKGSKALSGFSAVTLSARGDITGTGTGDLRTGADVTLASNRVTGGLRSNQSILAVDDSAATKTYYKVTLQKSAAPLLPTGSDALGAKLAITGFSIDHSGDIELAAGSIALTATGLDGITLQDGSRISAAGGQKTFGPTTVAAPGGTVALTALQGNVTSVAGSSIDVSGAASGGDAGTFSLTTSAATAVVKLEGNLTGTAAAGYVQGSAVLDLASAGDFSALNAKLNQGGFTESRDIRVRAGDVVIAAADAANQRAADVVTARHFKLSADGGSITVGGTIDASGNAGGGSIELDAMNDLTLSNGSFVLARGTSAASGAADAYSHGGSVELSSRTGTLSMEAGASVDVSANAAGKSNGGKVLFSAARTRNASGADADVAMNLAGKVSVGGGAIGGTAGTITIEGVRGYDGVTETASASDPAGVVASDYRSFVGNSQAILSRLAAQGLIVDGAAAATALRVSGGVELRSTGDMVVSSAWDLTTADWMPSATPGRLTLRAAGNLLVQNTLGFPDDNLVNAESWSIRLAGGADLQSADAMAVTASPAQGVAGNVVFGNLATFSYLNPRSNVGAWSGGAAKVRTGTGSIQIAAGGDVVIQGPLTLATDGRVIDAANMSSAPKVVIYTAGLPAFDGAVDSVYPTRGGDISIYAKRDITGAGGQLEYVNDWLRRTSSIEQNAIQGGPAGWWVARSAFRDDVGALGGGNISFVAGRNIANVSAAVPTFGRTFTDSTGAPAIDVQGGGNLDIRAGGNLDGGEYLLGRGNGRIVVSGSIGQQAAPALYLMGQSTDPALRGASYRVVAGGDIDIQNVSNPTILVSSSVPTQLDDSGEFLPGFERFRAAFFTYDDSSGVELLSVGGNLTIPGKQAPRVSKQPLSGNIDSQWSDFLPPHFSAVALQGGISGDHVQPSAPPTLLYPAAGSTLRLLGANTISNVAIEATDLTPATQPNWGWNSAFELTQERALLPDAINFDATAVNRMVTPSANTGYEFVVASAAGDVLDSTFMFSRQAWVSAGRDLRDVRLDLQNLADGDISVVKAGRDIRYVPAYSNGILDRTDQGGYIRIGGPGRLLVQAGRNVDLGATEGITAGGNNFNTSLPNSKSAALTVMAGVTGDIAFDAIDTLFTDLKEAGLAQKSAIADAAIQKVLNDDNTGPGSITMFFSAIRTQGGSGIDLLVPDGNINAGLPTPGGGNIGVFTTFGGGIRTYLSGDFNVNQSKVATLDGGNILIYSSRGNIDAGRGARDSRTTQAPQRVAILDDQGNPTGLFTFIPPSDASGSGIRSLTFDPDGPGPLTAPRPGDIFLFAPKGFIDAGEAGVSSAGNIFVAALQVLNANNFSAAGTSVGVPVTVNSGISAGLSGASSVGASAAKSAEDITKSLTTAAATVPKDIYRPSFISVEVLGVGDESQQKEDDRKK